VIAAGQLLDLIGGSGDDDLADVPGGAQRLQRPLVKRSPG
jgi:hypothetical protein